jgi:5-methyltetrahydropteroyltriglutamate--homocysteine methyltransferase
MQLIEAVRAGVNGSEQSLDALYDRATEDTIRQFEATGSPVITDGEQRKYQNFWIYSVQGEGSARAQDAGAAATATGIALK